MIFFKGFRKQFIISLVFILALIFVYNFYVFVGLTKIENVSNSDGIAQIGEEAEFLKKLSFWILLAAIIFISGVLIDIVLKLTFSLREILDGIEEIKLGNLEYQIPLKSGDEFGVIASFLNEAVRNLKDSKLKLQEKEESEAEILQGLNLNLKREITEQTSRLAKELKEKTEELEKLKKKC